MLWPYWEYSTDDKIETNLLISLEPIVWLAKEKLKELFFPFYFLKQFL